MKSVVFAATAVLLASAAHAAPTSTPFVSTLDNNGKCDQISEMASAQLGSGLAIAAAPVGILDDILGQLFGKAPRGDVGERINALAVAAQSPDCTQ